jgi:WD40 repeat protein
MDQLDQSTSPHPGVERLSAFAQGRATPEEVSAIEAHLLGCPSCCTALDGLPEDGLEALIRAAGRTTLKGGAGTGADSAPRPDVLAGRPCVPGYEVLEELGRGGTGIVYKAVQVGLGRTVALKMLLAGAHADVALLARFRAEGEAVGRLRHPNVVQVYDTGTSDGLPYFALEYVEHGSLEDLLHGTPQPPREAAAFLELLARATAAAHRAGIVHRDLKPGNVLLAHDPNREPRPGLASFVPKITDFGLAKWAEQREGLTRTGMVAGTPAYMAPEQAAGDHKGIGPPTDVWALGAILYELLTGRPPFQGSTTLDTLDLVRNAEPVPPHHLVPPLPRDLETICLKCLEKDPTRRYLGAEALSDDLTRFQRGEPIVARPVGAPARLWKWARRRPSLALLLALTSAALVGGAGVSTYFAVEAGHRAEDARDAERKALDLANERQQALLAAREARRESDRRAADLLFRQGTAQCESGAVARGLYTLLDAWMKAPEEDADFRRVVRTNLAAWRWHLPRLRGAAAHPYGGPFRPLALDDGATFFTWSGKGVQLWDAERVTAIGPPSPAHGDEYIHSAFSDGTVLCRGGGRYYFRRPGDAAADDVPLPEWVNPLTDVLIERRGPGDSDVLVKGPEKEPFLQVWRVGKEKKESVRVPSGGGLSYRVVADRAGRDVLVAFRRYPPGGGDALELWDLETGQRLAGFEPRAGGGDPTVSWDGRKLVTVSTVRAFNRFGPAGQDGSVRWWDPRTGRELDPPWQPRRAAWFTELGGDQATLASWCRDWRLRLYDLGTGLQRGGDLVINLDSTDGAWTSTFSLSPDGGTLIASDRHHEVHVWDVRHLRPQASAASSPRLPPSRPTAPSSASYAAFSPDGAVALVCSQSPRSVGGIIDAATNLPRGRPLEHLHAFNPVFSADGSRAVTLSHNHVFGGEPIARAWNTATGESLTPPLRNPENLYCAAFSPDGSVLALGGPNGTFLWDVVAATLLRPLPEKSTPASLLFSADGKRLAVGYRSGWPGVGSGLRVWDPQTGEPGSEFVSSGGDVNHLSFADGGRTVLALASGRLLWSFDAATGRPRGAPLTLLGGAAAVFAPDGSRVATADYSGTVRQWDTHTGAQVGGAMAHPTRVVSLHYAPGGGLLASVCEDESVRLWDARACLPLGPPLVHRSAVLAVQFSPDGRSLRAATASGGVHAWPVPEPVLDDTDRLARWVEVFAGMRRNGDEVTLLSAAPWRESAAEFASRWPEPDPALAIPEDPAAWHEARAAEAEEDGNVAAALLHLSRLSELRPGEWAYHARRGRALSEAGALAQAAEAYDQAEARCLKDVLNWYRHQIAILGSQGQHETTVKWYESRLRRAEATGVGCQK